MSEEIRKKQANRIEEIEKLYGKMPHFCYMAEHIYDSVHLTDGEGKILFVNEAYTRTTGITKAQCIGRTVQDIEGEGLLYKGSVTEEVILTGKRVNSIAYIYGLDKEVLVTGTPVFDADGKLAYVLCSTRDIDGLNEMKTHLKTLKADLGKGRQELEYLRLQQTRDLYVIEDSQQMKAILELVRNIADMDVTVLITGETGTGKEVIADQIYLNGNRYGKPFIKVNCAAIPVGLLESELFGYEEGAFTDARRGGKIGMFELANNGIILLDEIADMSLEMQAKLLRVLQEREIVRIGGTKPIKLDVRIIASTNKDLKNEMQKGNFREDLYYRLCVVPIQIEPLRNRKDEIPHLVQSFIGKFCRKHRKQIIVDSDAMEMLVEYDWPGNIRELENLIERLVVTNSSGVVDSITLSLMLDITPFTLPGSKAWQEGKTLKEYVQIYEKTLIKNALVKHGTIRKTAKILGIDHSTLSKKCKTYNIAIGE